MDHSQVLEYLGMALPKRMVSVKRALSGELLAWGSNHYIYTITVEDCQEQLRQVVVRVPVIDKLNRRKLLYKEHAILQYLERAAFGHAPQSYLYDFTLEYLPLPYAVQSFVKAEKVQVSADRCLKGIAELVVRLHSINVPNFLKNDVVPCGTWHEVILVKMKHLYDRIHKFFRSSSTLFRRTEMELVFIDAWHKVETSIKRAEDELCQVRAKPVLTHGDLGYYNLGWTSLGYYLFDWEDASIGDPASDVAILFRTSIPHTQWRNRFISAYLQLTSDPSNHCFIDRIELYESIAAIYSAIWVLEYISGTPLELREGKSWSERQFLENHFYSNLEHIEPDLAQAARDFLAASLS